jgi:hypothetical protein
MYSNLVRLPLSPWVSIFRQGFVGPPPYGKVLALSVNIRLGLKRDKVINALAYYAAGFIMAVKMLYDTVPKT